MALVVMEGLNLLDKKSLQKIEKKPILLVFKMLFFQVTNSLLRLNES